MTRYNGFLGFCRLLLTECVKCDTGMAFAPKETLGIKMQTKRSSWTPLNHHLSNSQVFEERKNLVVKWFDKWSDGQRKQVLQDFFSRCSVTQIKYLRHTLCAQVPEEALDFTSVLPRVLSLYIFSFLDPRSLCRCAQISWHWKNLVELDQLWMPKCLRLGWFISFTPTPFEQGVWKRHYLETVQGLHVSRPKPINKEEFIVSEVKEIDSKFKELTLEIGEWKPSTRSLPSRASVMPAKGPPPWRDSDRHPTDTIRFNYLDNLDPIEHARQAQSRSRRIDLIPTQERTEKKTVSASSYKRCKAKAMMFSALDLSGDIKMKQSRPKWASSKDPEKTFSSTQWNAGIRPAPVRNPIPRLTERNLRASLRSHRSTPNAQPTEGERDVWNQVNAVLQESESILQGLQAYKGAGQEIRDAIQNPNDLLLQERAWNSVCPLVIRLKKFYGFSLKLEKALKSLLECLTCPPYTPTQHLEKEQALAKQFAEILHFTLRFDELKMRIPAIQNDFSYYRRTISRNRINNMNLDIENEVNNEMANRMSLFYAEATPMLKTLSTATTNFVTENKTLPLENTTDCLSTMASVCKVMLETPEYTSRFNSEDTLLFCMRVMVGVIILYDHVHPNGAFTKSSKIDMKGCIKVLKEQPADNVEGLLNALKFTTKHLNDESTPKNIRSMLQ
ncbi:Protein FAM49A [Bagarius yarrelli]|uniref:Protein FAM49A n=1 Tax=Bagarius yarrelli TaxID=175774 RepID=A0A556U7G5_BAGYA|nr:Protein FAM49A [Bagarius yarrelli]